MSSTSEENLSLTSYPEPRDKQALLDKLTQLTAPTNLNWLGCPDWIKTDKQVLLALADSTSAGYQIYQQAAKDLQLDFSFAKSLTLAIVKYQEELSPQPALRGLSEEEYLRRRWFQSQLELFSSPSLKPYLSHLVELDQQWHGLLPWELRNYKHLFTQGILSIDRLANSASSLRADEELAGLYLEAKGYLPHQNGNGADRPSQLTDEAAKRLLINHCRGKKLQTPPLNSILAIFSAHIQSDWLGYNLLAGLSPELQGDRELVTVVCSYQPASLADIDAELTGDLDLFLTILQACPKLAVLKFAQPKLRYHYEILKLLQTYRSWSDILADYQRRSQTPLLAMAEPETLAQLHLDGYFPDLFDRLQALEDQGPTYPLLTDQAKANFKTLYQLIQWHYLQLQAAKIRSAFSVKIHGDWPADLDFQW